MRRRRATDGHRRPLHEPHEAELAALVAGTPDVTLVGLQAELKRRFGIVAALSTLHATLRRIGLRHKKFLESDRACPMSRPSVGGGAPGSVSWIQRGSLFLDETGTATNMARRYGRSRSGTRLVAAVPHGHWRTTTIIAGLRQTGIVAPSHRSCSTGR